MPELYNKLKQITIVGTGSWGTAIAKVIAENNPGTVVKMWSYEKSTTTSINIKNQNSEFLPGIKLPYNIKATTHLSESLLNTEGIIIATPSKVIPDTIQKISKLLKKDIPLAYLTKGFCKINNEILTISQAISKLLPGYATRVVGISGPSHAEEVVKYYHTTLSVAGYSSSDRRFFSDLLNCEYLKCRETEDIIGVDLGGTLKNPAAIAAGLISKLPECGDNLEGALIAESLKEMIKLGSFLGAKIETIIDISGTGDLVATALSDHSRNRRFGKDIAKQIIEKGTILSWTDKIYLRFKPEYVLEKMSEKLHYLAEGAYAIEPLIELAEKNSISIPVYRSLYEVLLNKKEPSLLIETIKNPDSFDEIYNNAKIHVKDKKQGLEKLKGKAFKNLILNQLILKFKKDDSTITESAILDNLKVTLNENIKQNTFFFKNEIKLVTEFITNNSEKSLKKIINLYLKETMDHYNPLFYQVYVRLLKFKYLWNKLIGHKNEITVTGDFYNMLGVISSYNTIYMAKSKNINDYIYYFYGINKCILPVLRFFVSSDSLETWFEEYIIRKTGGFIIHKSKLNNLLYYECIMGYLSILASHGVPVLYFPELHESESSMLVSQSSDKFFNMLNNVMFNETTEIVLIPSEITYKNRLDESLTKDVFTEPVGINFSAPVFLSEYTKQSNMEISISELINKIWLMDEIILPHYIICGILIDNMYIIKAAKLKKIINKYILDNNIIINKTDKSILIEGVKFLIKNNIIIKRDDYYVGLKHDQIKKFSDFIKNRNIL